MKTTNLLKNSFSYLTMLIFLFSFSHFTLAQTNIQDRAHDKDTVWVIINHVKPDQREQFEKFVHEIFWNGAKKLSPEEQRVFKQTRILHPVEQEQDGTYSYVFIMDPVIPGADYNIKNLLNKMYGEQKADEHFKMFLESLTGDQTRYILIQSPH